MGHSHEHKKLSNDPVVRGHETSDLDARSVFISGLLVSLGLTIVGLLIAWGAYAYYKASSIVPGTAANTVMIPDSSTLPPLPRLQEDPHVVLVPLVNSQDSILASCSWVNKDSGIVHIPIERAMRLAVQRGFQVYAKAREKQ